MFCISDTIINHQRICVVIERVKQRNREIYEDREAKTIEIERKREIPKEKRNRQRERERHRETGRERQSILAY